MRILVFLACFFFGLGVLEAQQAPSKPHSSNPRIPCGDELKGLPYSYYTAVLETIKPPHWEKALNRITVGSEKKIVLLTNGEKFLLWAETPDIPKQYNNIDDFLMHLAVECRLPADPENAAGLIKINWESKELTEAEYTRLHREFTDAVAKYVSQIQRRYPEMLATRTWVQYCDTSRYTIVYDNWFEHIAVEAWNVPAVDLVKWVYQIHKLAEDSVHKSFGATSGE
jgi:hypothetical protein